MRVDAQRRTGHQRDQILAFDEFQELVRIRIDHPRRTDLVFEDLAEDFDGEMVADFDFVEVGEHLRVGEAPVGGQDRMRVDAADGQGGAFEVPDSLEEGLFGGPVVNGKIEVDGGDSQARHEAAAHREETLVVVG